MTALRRTIQSARFVEPKGETPPKTRKFKIKRRGYGPWLPNDDPVMVPKSGRSNLTYRDERRNIYTLTNTGNLVRRKNERFQPDAEYSVYYQFNHPELQRKISNRGEIHYVARREEVDLDGGRNEGSNGSRNTVHSSTRNFERADKMARM